MTIRILTILTIIATFSKKDDAPELLIQVTGSIKNSAIAINILILRQRLEYFSYSINLQISNSYVQGYGRHLDNIHMKLTI